MERVVKFLKEAETYIWQQWKNACKFRVDESWIFTYRY